VAEKVEENGMPKILNFVEGNKMESVGNFFLPTLKHHAVNFEKNKIIFFTIKPWMETKIWLRFF